MTTKLSPAATAAIVAAFNSEHSSSFDACTLDEYRPLVAAALRISAAGMLREYNDDEDSTDEFINGVTCGAMFLEEIANELS